MGFRGSRLPQSPLPCPAASISVRVLITNWMFRSIFDNRMAFLQVGKTIRYTSQKQPYLDQVNANIATIGQKIVEWPPTSPDRLGSKKSCYNAMAEPRRDDWEGRGSFKVDSFHCTAYRHNVKRRKYCGERSPTTSGVVSTSRPTAKHSERPGLEPTPPRRWV